MLKQKAMKRGPMNAARIIGIGLIAALLCGCRPHFEKDRVTIDYPHGLDLSLSPPSPVIRQPVLPEMLKACRGHVLVPALGMKFVARAGTAPDSGQFLREESISAPYRIITPHARISQEQNPVRLNVELDSYDRIVGLYCG